MKHALQKLQSRINDPRVIRYFEDLIDRFESEPNHSGLPWNTFIPATPSDFPKLNELDTHLEAIGQQRLSQLAVLKLNGGLGTSMGCTGPKSLVPLDNDHNFLDFFFKQMETIQSRYNTAIPVLFMNSFATQSDTQHYISTHPTSLDIRQFKQHEFPRLDASTHDPVRFSDETEEWAPPGHGNVYVALWTSGLLDQLISEGKTILMMSNSDNLGAVVDLKILGYMAQKGNQFIMEVTPKTPADRKGGVIVKQKTSKRFHLLERSQVPENHISDFEDIHQFPLFNTNTIWIHLPTLKTLLENHSLHLSPIANPKTIEGKSIIQLESAMGAAITEFPNATCMVVTRNRFMPVKTTADLMILQSNLVNRDDIINWHYTVAPETLPKIQLNAELSEVNRYLEKVKQVPDLKNVKSIVIDNAVELSGQEKWLGEVKI